VVLAALSTGHKIGLAVVAIVFISFALTCSLIIPRRRPDFPGKNGLPVFIIVSLFLFVSMVSAVVIFGKESEAKGASEAKGVSVHVVESEYKITLARKAVPAGPVTFLVANSGKLQHDLAVQGGKATPLIDPGKSATLTVTLKKGTTIVFCNVPGHRQLGMVAKLTVT
jgi:nitrite reductase (NO-forming)